MGLLLILFVVVVSSIRGNVLVRTCCNYERFAVLFLLQIITLFTSAVEIEENNVSVNKPIMDHPGWVHFSTEYVRCFCNLPSCIATGYMCKSSAGGCFSDLLDQDTQAVSSKDYRGIHGCDELLTDRDQKKWCQSNLSSPRKSTYRRKNNPKSLLVCCYHDMCNHADSPATKILFNDTAVLGEINDNDSRSADSVGTKQDPAMYTESEVWFRAATIAVPICGAVILLALIGLAVRLLRTESSRNSTDKLGALPYMLSSDRKMNRQHNYIVKQPHHNNPLCSNDTEDVHIQSYLPLLIQTETRNSDSNCKNETNAKLNFIQDFEHSCVRMCDSDAKFSPEFYKNTDLHIGRNIVLTDNSLQHHNDTHLVKVYDKEVIS